MQANATRSPSNGSHRTQLSSPGPEGPESTEAPEGPAAADPGPASAAPASAAPALAAPDQAAPTRVARDAEVRRDLVLPCSEAPELDAPARLPHPTSDHDPDACVLIVDDNLLVRHTIRRMLANEYSTVIDAPDLERGMRACGKLEVRILILDLILPNCEVTTSLRDARRRFPRARVLAITGGGRSGPHCLLTVARKLGAFAALQKPFRREALLDVLRTNESH